MFDCILVQIYPFRCADWGCQFCVTKPEDSPAMLQHMVDNSEAFYQSLEIPYRVVGIVSGALNNAAAIKYDLEAWFPYQGEYKELVSCSNCTDYRESTTPILGLECGLHADDSRLDV